MKVTGKKIVALSVLAAGTLMLSGCSAAKEALNSQMEVPTVEKQMNRVAIGVTMVRLNHLMDSKLPLSADSKWPQEVSKPMGKKEMEDLKQKLYDIDPYFATVNYTEPIQRKNLGSGFLMNHLGDAGQLVAGAAYQAVTPLTMRAYHKIEVFYGNDPKNWPDVFNFKKTKKFVEFPKEDQKKLDISKFKVATTGNLYNKIGDAMMDLIPVNLQKDIKAAKSDMEDAQAKLEDLNRQKADVEAKLKKDDAQKSIQKVTLKAINVKTEPVKPLTPQERAQLEEEKKTLKEEIKAAESVLKEKQDIYFSLLENAGEELKSDINLDDEAYVKLALNVNKIADQIDEGATEAYTQFGIAATQLLVNGALVNFGKELQTLALAKPAVPVNLQSKYNARVERLMKNLFLIVPNMVMGTYYAHQQATVAEKYKEYTDIIVEAYNTKKEQEEAAKKAAEEAKAKKAENTKE